MSKCPTSGRQAVSQSQSARVSQWSTSNLVLVVAPWALERLQVDPEGRRRLHVSTPCVNPLDVRQSGCYATARHGQPPGTAYSR